MLDTSLAAEVRHYFLQTPRQLPSRALYDALGSALFDAICELPWYPLTRAERRLLRSHRDAIFRSASYPSRIVELGPGNGSKLELLLGEPPGAGHVERIELIDVSAAALRDAADRLRDRTAAITTHQRRYEDGLAATRQTAKATDRTLVLFLGSNIGNFDPEGATAFLRRVRQALGADDRLLVGADLVKPENELLLAYDDPLGVTAAFNRNLLLNLNGTLGANFDVDEFNHQAVWNQKASRVEMHLVSRRDQRIDIPASGLSENLRAGELIWTESSYKYTVPGFERLLYAANLTIAEHWVDAEGRFLLALSRPS